MQQTDDKLARNSSKSGCKILQDSVARLCINLQDRPEKRKSPLWNFIGEGTTKRKRQNLAKEIAREKYQHKTVVQSGAGNARVHNETQPRTRSNVGQFDWSMTQVAANDTTY